ncbi:MAG: NAD-dependent deacylase [Ignavibacteria bacterium]|nr:NAD-dependent deacylase [Ignavibacteria bacterium]
MTISAKGISVLESAASVCVLTGAGISAESGVPTFRGKEGLWSKFKPEELANFRAFINNPDLVWEWYTYRKNVMKDVKPNPAHLALAEMERIVEDFTLVTQNVDNLHQRGGSRNVYELHGNIERSYCIDCRRPEQNVMLDEQGKAPRCKSCGGLIRPDVVWFGELLPYETFQMGAAAAARCDLFLLIGTSGIVYPAASLPLVARDHGAYVLEVNQEYTDLSSRVSETIVGKAGVIVPEMLASMKNTRKRGTNSE